MFVRKVLLLTLVAILFLIPIGVGGCVKEISAQEISNNVILKYPSVDTFKMNMNSTIAMEIVSDNQQMKSDTNAVFVGFINLAAKELQVGMDVEMSISKQGTQKAFAEYYVVNGQAYMNMKMTTLGLDQWVKMEAPETIWDSQNQLDQQIDFLQNAVEVTKLGEEKVDGVATYVLQVKPDQAEALKWFMSQQSGSLGVDYTKTDFNKIFKDFSLKMWIAKDSSLPVKESLNITMEILPEDVGADASETGKVTINITTQVKYYDYGKPITIELPKEALDAPSSPTTSFRFTFR